MVFPAVLPAGGFCGERASKRYIAMFDGLALRLPVKRVIFSIEASVFDIAPEGTQLPIDATGADVCLAVARIGEVRVAASIGERALQNAKTELLACIDQAVHALQPYGVTRADVDAVVRQALQQKANANTK